MTVFLLERCVDWDLPEFLGVYADKASAEKAMRSDILYYNSKYDWELNEDDNYNISEEYVIQL